MAAMGICKETIPARTVRRPVQTIPAIVYTQAAMYGSPDNEDKPVYRVRAAQPDREDTEILYKRIGRNKEGEL